MVIGETEILGQVKKAYAAASSAGATSRHLNKLFQRAFNVAKEVRTKTNITSGPVSVGSVAIDLAERIFGELAACHAMILGAGEMSEITARSLLSRGVERMIVSNRSPERAEALAAEMRGKAVPFSDWPRHLQEADILISSTAAPHPIVTPETVAQAMEVRPERPLFIIDLAVPRDVEPSVNAIDGVYLYDIDSLQAIARQGIEMRRREITACEALIERHVADFLHWLDADPAARSRPPTKLH
jgi:glutamyl-tRNA reductase